MRTYEEGRHDQFREMMQALGQLEGKYKGVRGELLAKVRAELMKAKPTGAVLSVVGSDDDASSATSCRVCGRAMKASGTDGRLVCMNGHSR